MNIKSSPKKEPSTIILFLSSIVLVFVFLVVSLTFHKSGPSIRDGATEEEINSYAYQLLEAKPENSMGYHEAIKYYETQISAAEDPDQVFSLKLDLASFFGRTGDPASGLGVLGDISANALSLDRRYYLYAALAYLYARSGDLEAADSYQQLIVDEGIYDYIAKLDAGEIDSESPVQKTDTEDDDSKEEHWDDSENEAL